MSRSRAADDFTTIRARIKELRRAAAEPNAAEHPRCGSSEAPLDDHEQRLQEHREGQPPPWVPTIFLAAPDAAPDDRSGGGPPRACYSAG